MKIASFLLFLPSALSIADLLPTIEFCPVEGLSIPGIDCFCNNTILPPVLMSKCATSFADCEPILESVCGDVTLTTKLDLLSILRLQSPVTMTACYENIEFFEAAIPFFNELCFEFIAPLIDLFTGFLGADSVSADGGVLPTAAGGYSMCNALADGEICDYCDMCDDGNGGVGVLFKCGEVESTNCTTISTKSLPMSTRGAVNVDSIVPPRITVG